MTPLATDGPGSGSGAGFGRDHAEKWQSGGVSHTTLMVTNVTDSICLNPASTRTRTPSLTRSPGTGPVLKHRRSTVDIPSFEGRRNPALGAGLYESVLGELSHP